MARWKPQWLVLVPRVLEKVAGGVEAKFASGSAAQRGIVKLASRAGRARNAYRRIAGGLVVGERPGLARRLAARGKAALLKPAALAGDKLVWSKVRAGFGGRLKCIIAGGSATATALESFYDLAGIQVIGGYGLTECSPLLSFRRGDENLKAGVGKPCHETQVKVVDPATGAEVGTGEVGLVKARGPQVMSGYYRNEAATKAAIDEEGCE
jgi:long-chain acyl-CoA synthetase